MVIRLRAAFFVWLWLYAGSSLALIADLPKVVNVERTTPVFEAASTRSKILADVEVGTSVIARELSSRGKWLRIEDEDGNTGWVPRSRTSYVSSVAPEKPSKFRTSEKSEEAAADSDIEMAKEEQGRLDRKLEISNGSSTFVGLQASSLGAGPALTLFLPPSLSGASESRVRRLGLELSAYRSWKEISNSFQWSIPLRARMIAGDSDSYIGSGPDLGAVYRVSSKRLALSLGYSIGYVPLSGSGLATLARAGIETGGGKTHYLLQWEMGWLF